MTKCKSILIILDDIYHHRYQNGWDYIYMRRQATSEIQYELLLLVIGKVVVYPFIVKITLC